jgi:hypothetical protein
MRAVLTRVLARKWRAHRRPAHAMPSAERTKRTATRNPQNGARHAADDRVRVAEALRARFAPEIRQRVTRVIHAPRVPEFGVALLADRAWVWQGLVRAVRTPAFGVAMITCLISAGVLTATLSPRPTSPPPARGTSLTPKAPFGTVSGTSSGSQSDAGKPPPPGQVPHTGAAPPGDVPQTGAAPPSDAGPQTSEGPGHDLSLDSQGLPPASPDPDLEAALSDLDKRADFDQRHSLDQRPPVPTAGPPAALTDGQPPDAPPPATSATAPAP